VKPTMPPTHGQTNRMQAVSKKWGKFAFARSRYAKKRLSS